MASVKRFLPLLLLMAAAFPSHAVPTVLVGRPLGYEPLRHTLGSVISSLGKK